MTATEGAHGTASPETTLEASVEATAPAVPQRTKEFGFLPIPPHLRYDEQQPQKFGIVLQFTFVAATTFSEWDACLPDASLIKCPG